MLLEKCRELIDVCSKENCTKCNRVNYGKLEFYHCSLFPEWLFLIIYPLTPSRPFSMNAIYFCMQCNGCIGVLKLLHVLVNWPVTLDPHTQLMLHSLHLSNERSKIHCGFAYFAGQF